MDFVAIDVETANSRRGSICAMAAVVVRGGAVISTRSWLMRPPPGLDEFHAFNIGLHGITPGAVAAQPAFADRLDELLDLSAGLPLVAHNAAFDIGALREACVAIDRHWPSLDYGCSLVMSRRALDLISYRLPVVAAECGIDLVDHHDPHADALTCAYIVLEIARRREARTFPELCTGLQVLAGRLEAAVWRGCHSSSKAHAVAPPAAYPGADPSHPLYGQVMVFTGALSVRRRDAWEAVAACGAVVENGVNKHTTMLVVGDGFSGDDPADFWTGKAAKAARWREKGHRIEVLTEADLTDLVAETITSGSREQAGHGLAEVAIARR
ncbi:MAG TPA: exonuclease domain-containing protein [Pseudonocardiaceae bacterium]